MTEELWGLTETLVKDEELNRKFHATAVAAIKEAVEVINSDDWKNKTGWKFEQESTETGDKSYSKVLHKNKAFCIVGEIPVSADALLAELSKNAAGIPSWNPSVLEYRMLFPLGEQSDVVYSVTADALGGLVKSRDLLSTRIWRKIDECWYLTEVSIEWDGMPPQKGKTRAYGYPGMVKISPVEGKTDHCTMEWMMNTDLKGMLLKSVVKTALLKLLKDSIENLRKMMIKKKEEMSE